MVKIGLIIPSTSKGRDWKSYKETYLFKHTIKTFVLTYNSEHNYTFYIGIDKNDKIYDNENVKKNIKRFVNVMKNIDIEFIYMDNIEKGHLTVMWNRLFKKAYDDGCDYFFQCGDDIEFKTKNWVNDCIDTLKKNNNIGMTGPINNNPKILTQSFVSRTHMQLFGYYFPPEIINWFCDDWINMIYIHLKCFFPLKQHFCDNIGGNPRYDINNNKEWNNNHQDNYLKLREHCYQIVKRDIKKCLNL